MLFSASVTVSMATRMCILEFHPSWRMWYFVEPLSVCCLPCRMNWRSSLRSRAWAASHRFLKHLHHLMFCDVGFLFSSMYVNTGWLVLVKYLQNSVLFSQLRALFWWLFKKYSFVFGFVFLHTHTMYIIDITSYIELSVFLKPKQWWPQNMYFFL